MQVDNAALEDGNEEFDQDLEAGFSGNDTPTETPEIVSDEQQATPEVVAQEEPKLRQLTEEEYTKLMSGASSIDEMKASMSKQVDTAFGKIGGIERVLKQIQEQTPSGEAVEITEDDLAEIREEFPELVGPQLKALQRIAGKMRGTGGSVSEDHIRELVKPSLASISEFAVERAKTEIAAETLDDTHPGWKSVVGVPENGVTPNTEFRQWLDTQKPEYKARVLNTYSASVIGKAIDSFNESRIRKQKDSERRDRFSQAVNPKGDSGGFTPSSVDDEDSAFAEGYKSR